MSWKTIVSYRDALESESGTVYKDWGGKIPVALVFPNTYFTGMSNLGFQAIYGLFNAYPDVVCERVFLPDAELARQLARTGTKLFSYESQRPLADFEFVAFSLPFENDYPNVLRILEMAGLAWRSEDRRDHDPLIMAGGVTMRLNPEPLAESMDLVLIGDGEPIVPELLRAWREMRLESLPRKDRILHLARSVSGSYAPAFYKTEYDRNGRIKSFEPVIKDLPEKIKSVREIPLTPPALNSRILTPNTEFASTRLIEIGRGCGRGCRFCLAGFEYRPPRLVETKAIIEAALNSENPSKRVGLVSPAVADHPDLDHIVRTLVDHELEVTLSSMRVESILPETLEALVKGGLRSAAIAPEAGSERLRKCINKDLTDNQILDGTQKLAESGLKRIKLYFMAGLPGETMDDISAMADLVKKIKDRLLKKFKNRKLLPEITLSISSFVPKAATPFQTEPMNSIKELKEKAKKLRALLKGVKGVRINWDVPKWSYLQGVLARGDRRTFLLVEALARKNGSLTQGLRDIPFNPDFFATRRFDQDEKFAWSFIDRGVKPGYLLSEMDRALEGAASPRCDTETCRRCGLCGSES